jgi:hypothetical protein
MKGPALRAPSEAFPTPRDLFAHVIRDAREVHRVDQWWVIGSGEETLVISRTRLDTLATPVDAPSIAEAVSIHNARHRVRPVRAGILRRPDPRFWELADLTESEAATLIDAIFVAALARDPDYHAIAAIDG